MKSNILLILVCSMLSFSSFGQTDPSIWKNVMKIEDNKFVANVPEGWKKVTQAEGSTADYKYDFSGVGIPTIAKENSPLYANFTVSRMAGNKPAKAMELVMGEFSNFSDRLTEPNYNYDTATATTKSGEMGKLLHTRYYRRSKVSNYSKYFLIVYSPEG